MNHYELQENNSFHGVRFQSYCPLSDIWNLPESYSITYQSFSPSVVISKYYFVLCHSHLWFVGKEQNDILIQEKKILRETRLHCRQFSSGCTDKTQCQHQLSVTVLFELWELDVFELIQGLQIRQTLVYPQSGSVSSLSFTWKTERPCKQSVQTVTSTHAF